MVNWWARSSTVGAYRRSHSSLGLARPDSLIIPNIRTQNVCLKGIGIRGKIKKEKKKKHPPRASQIMNWNLDGENCCGVVVGGGGVSLPSLAKEKKPLATVQLSTVPPHQLGPLFCHINQNGFRPTYCDLISRCFH